MKRIEPGGRTLSKAKFDPFTILAVAIDTLWLIAKELDCKMDADSILAAIRELKKTSGSTH